MENVYHLFVTGWKGDDIFIGSFSTLDKAQALANAMGLFNGAHVDLDVMDAPVDEQNTVWVLEPKNSSTSNGHH
jgi:hypothetical protein